MKARIELYLRGMLVVEEEFDIPEYQKIKVKFEQRTKLRIGFVDAMLEMFRAKYCAGIAKSKGDYAIVLVAESGMRESE